MAEYDGTYEGNGEDADNLGDGPVPQSRGHGDPDDHSDSKIQHGSRRDERESSRSRDKDRERGRRSRDRNREGDRERDGGRDRQRDRDIEKDRDNGRRHRDDYRDRSDRRERGRSRDNGEYYRSRDHDRRSEGIEKEDKYRHSSPSRSRRRSKHRSRSRSPSSHSGSKRVSGFDMAPPASALFAGAASAAVWKVHIKLHGVVWQSWITFQVVILPSMGGS